MNEDYIFFFFDKFKMRKNCDLNYKNEISNS